MAGTYTINPGTWEVVTTGANPRGEVAFGNITNADENTDPDAAIQVGAVGATASATSHNSMLLIPHEYKGNDDEKMTISYTIETLLNDVVIDRDENLTITPNEVELVAGHAYNFVFKKGNPGDPIKFQLNVVDQWDPATGGTDKNI